MILLLRAQPIIPVRAAMILLLLISSAELRADEFVTGITIMKKARAALGEPPEIVLRGEGTFDPGAQMQGFTPDSVNAVPFREELTLTADGRVGYESRFTRHDGTEEWLRFAYDGDEMQFVQMTEGFAARVIDREFEDASARLARMVPQRLLEDALANAASIRHLGRAMRGGVGIDRVAFALASGELMALEIDDRGRVRGFDYRVDLPLLGDTRIEWVYDEYRSAGKVLVPAGYEIRVGGRRLKRVAWTVESRAAADSPVFEIPDAIEPPPAPARPADGAPPSPPPSPRVVERAPGVWQILRLRSGFHPMFVEMKDYVIAFDAPTGWLELHQVPASNFVSGATSTSVTEDFIRLIHETVPEKPIRYVVLSHFHNDHSGGVRAFVAEGATIVTTETGRIAIEAAMRRPHHIAADRLRDEEVDVNFRIVDGQSEISDGEARVELIEVPNPHVEGMLVTWLPEAKLIFVCDLFLPLTKNFPSKSELPMNLAFAEWLESSGLEPEIILAIHGAGRGTRDQIEILRRVAEDRNGR